MPRFRKKPIEIEAIRFLGMRLGAMEWSSVIPQWLLDAMLKDHETPGSAYLFGDHFQISTLEGSHLASPGDWIIRGVAGEIYPCKPEIFAATYDEVSA